MRRSEYTRQLDRRKESEVEHGTEGEDTSRQLIRSGTQFLATHRYEKNLDGPVEMSCI